MPKLSAIPKDSDHEESVLSLNDSNDVGTEQSPRLWAVTYVCVVAVQALCLSGFSLGFTSRVTSPVLTKLSDKNTGYKSLKSTAFQDAFNVSDIIN